MRDGHGLVTVREATHRPRTPHGRGGQRRGGRRAHLAVTVERAREALPEVGGQEGVDDGVHARVGVRQRVRADAEVVEGVRVAPRGGRVVRPQPDDVRRQPAETEDGHDDDDQSRDLALDPQALVVSAPAAPPDGIRRFPDEPQLADHERTKHEDGDERDDVTDDEQNEVVGGAVVHGAAPVVCADGDGFRSDVAIHADGVEDGPRERDKHRHEPDDQGRG